MTYSMVGLCILEVAGTDDVLHDAILGYTEKTGSKINMCQQADCSEMVLLFFIVVKIKMQN